jgi:hypothetical protein
MNRDEYGKRAAQCAAHCDDLAAQAVFPEVREQMQALARQWRLIADQRAKLEHDLVQLPPETRSPVIVLLETEKLSRR